jgi:hypothetical protein
MLSVYIDFAIGLVLAFLLLSLLVSGINEGLVRLLSVRSKFLWAYLRDTLDGGLPPDRHSARVFGLVSRGVEAMGRLPAIGGFVRRVFRDFASWNARSRLPMTVLGVLLKFPFSGDPRPRFSETPAPKDIPTAGSMTDAIYERLQEIDHARGGRTTISDIPPERFGVAVMELAMGHGGVQSLLNRLRDHGSPLFRPLQSVWEGAADDLEAFRTGVQRWFDGEMQRLTILYRRYVRWVVAVIGLLVTLAFSVDSLQYGKDLLHDGAQRSAVAALAVADQEQLGSLRDMCAGDPGNTDAYTCITNILSTPAFVEVFGNGPLSLTIPESGTPQVTWNVAAWWERVTMPEHWPGYLVTFVALLFGASFWWDVLRRLTGLRPGAGTRTQ